MTEPDDAADDGATDAPALRADGGTARAEDALAAEEGTPANEDPTTAAVADSRESDVVRSRVMAHVIDQLVVPVAAMPLYAVVTALGVDSDVILYGVVLGFYVLYSVWLEGAWNGQTFGKYVTGVQVRGEDGGPASWADVTVRNVPSLFVFLMGPGLLLYLAGYFGPAYIPATADAIYEATGMTRPLPVFVVLFVPGLLCYAVALGAMVTDDRHRRLFDRLAGTVVVSTE